MTINVHKNTLLITIIALVVIVAARVRSNTLQMVIFFIAIIFANLMRRNIKLFLLSKRKIARVSLDEYTLNPINLLGNIEYIYMLVSVLFNYPLYTLLRSRTNARINGMSDYRRISKVLGFGGILTDILLIAVSSLIYLGLTKGIFTHFLPYNLNSNLLYFTVSVIRISITMFLFNLIPFFNFDLGEVIFGYLDSDYISMSIRYLRYTNLIQAVLLFALVILGVFDNAFITYIRFIS